MDRSSTDMRVLCVLLALLAPAAVSCASQPYDAPALQWYTILGGSGTSNATAVATDGQGNLYIAGNTTSLDMPTVAAAQQYPGGSSVVRISYSGASQNIFFQGATSIGNVQSIAADPENPQSIYAAGAGGILHSLDGGNTWTNLAPLPASPTLISLTVDPTNGSILYASAAPGGAFKSTDGGASWIAVNKGVPPASDGSSDVYQIWVDPKSPAVLLASSAIGSGFGLLRSADRGANWTQVLANGSCVAFDPFTPGTVYACGPYFGPISVSRDDGQTWTTLATLPAQSGANVIVADPFHRGTLYAGGYGLFQSTDGGVTWTQKVDTSVTSSTSAMAADPNRPAIYAGVWPNGILASTDGFNTYKLLAPQLLQVGQIVVAGANVFAVPALTTDVFVAKLDANGKFLYTTYFGGSASDTASAIAVGKDGSVYVTGATNSTDFPVTPGSYTGGGKASYLFKLKPDGSLAWSTFFADADTTVNAVAVDDQGDAYLTGFTTGDLPTTPGAYQSSPNPPQGPTCSPTAIFCPLPFTPTSAFLTKFNASGSGLIFSTYIASNAQNVLITNANNLALAPNGSVYLAGGGVFEMNVGGSALLADYLPLGGLNVLAVDGSGNVYVTGAGSGLVTAGAFQTSPPFSIPNLPGTSGSSEPNCLTKFDPSLSTVLSGTFLTGEAQDTGASIAIDATGNVITAGNTTSYSFPTRAPFQGNFGGSGGSGYVAGLDPALSQLLFSTFLGDGPFHVAGAVPDGYGNILLAGSTPSTVVANKIALPPAPAPRLDSVVNAASRIAGPLSPGETIAALGAGFGPNARLIINGEAATVASQSASSIVALVPADIPTTGALAVKVSSGGTASNLVYMPAAVASPGIYSVNGSGTGQGYILNSDRTVNSPSNPAAMGSNITILATGVGAGLPVSVYIDGFYANIISAVTRPVPGLPGPVYELTVNVPNPALDASQDPALAGFVMPPQVEVRIIVGDVNSANSDWSAIISQAGIALSVQQ